MAVETRTSEENPQENWLYKNVPIEHGMEYYVPATLRRYFNFPIDFRSGALDPDGRLPNPKAYQAVIIDGPVTGRRVDEIERQVRLSARGRMINIALNGNPLAVYGVLNVGEKPEDENDSPLSHLDLQRAFLLAFDRRYKEIGRDSKNLVLQKIDQERLRFQYNFLRGEGDVLPLTDDRIIEIIGDTIGNIIKANPDLQATRKPQV